MEISTKKLCYHNLDKLSIKFKDGLINGVYGANGSGKTSLSNILSMYGRPLKGNVDLDGITIDNDNPMINYNMIRFEVGYVSQNPGDYMFLDSVKDQMMYVLNQYGYKNNIKHIKDSLKMVGLEEVLDRRINTLSSGELFKLSLAIILSLNPKIIILDEPMAFLDNKNQKELIKLLRILKNRYKKNIIILSKDINCIYEMCDYIYLLSNNHIILEGTKNDVFKQQKKLKDNNIQIPQLIEFVNLVKEKKNIKMGYRDNINDLLKDIYFYYQKF